MPGNNNNAAANKDLVGRPAVNALKELASGAMKINGNGAPHAVNKSLFGGLLRNLGTFKSPSAETLKAAQSSLDQACKITFNNFSG